MSVIYLLCTEPSSDAGRAPHIYPTPLVSLVVRLFTSLPLVMARTKPERPLLEKYPYKTVISTRWSDNDQYGHLNNAVYYQFYDALINSYMMEHCNWHPQGIADPKNKTKFQIPENHQIGLVVSSGTEYYELIRGFPTPLTLGLAVTKLGHSSVEYEIGVFQESARAKAVGRFVHVFVDQKSDKTRPEGMPEAIKKGLSELLIKKPLL